MAVGLMVATTLVGAGVGAYTSYQQSQNAKDAAEDQKAALEDRIAANREHAQTQHSITMERLNSQSSQIADQRQTADFSRRKQFQEIGLARTELTSQRELAKTQYDGAIGGLREARQRARKNITQETRIQTGAAAAMGGRGGSTQEVIGMKSQQARSQMESEASRQETTLEAQRGAQKTGFRTQSQRLTLGEEAARHQYQMQNRQLDRAQTDLGRERRSADSALENADAGWTYQSEMADIQLDQMNRQAAYAPWTGAMQGGVQGFQLGSNIYEFDQEFDMGWFS